MASSSSNGQQVDADGYEQVVTPVRDELTNIIRQCVRREMESQQRTVRPGISNIMHRTRDLIARSTTSACREYERNLLHQSEATCCPSIGSASSLNHSSAPSNINSTPSTSTGLLPKRPAMRSNPCHPWRFKKAKTKTKPNQMITKSVCLLDTPRNFDESDEESVNNPDYALVDNMILVKGICDIGTSYCEVDIRKEIVEMLQQKFPAITAGLFDFVKRERNRVVTPVVKPSHKWDFKQIKELCGQGKLYVRLNVPREALESSEEERASTSAQNMMQVSPNSSDSCSTHMHSVDGHVSPILVTYSPNPVNDDLIHDDLQQMLPGTSAETIANALERHSGDINSTLDTLLPAREEMAVETPSLSVLLKKLKDKMKSKPAKITVDVDDLFNDAIAFYKNAEFDPEQPVRVTFNQQPAIDGGGVLRQFYTDLFSTFVDEKMLMFVGEYNRKSPIHSPQMVFSGLLEIVGKIIAHSVAQGGPAFPFLSLPCYYYLATGDVVSALAYCDPWDVPELPSRQCILKVLDATTEEEFRALGDDDEFLEVFSSCGDTSMLKLANKRKIIQSIEAYEVIGKRKMALDQLRKGMKTLGVLEVMEKYPQLFEELFHPKPKSLTSLCVKENLLFPRQPNEDDNRVTGMLIQFVEQSSQERLQAFLKFCIGGNDFRLIRGKKITVEFHNQSYIQASTCSLKLQLPSSISSYDLFEMALEAALSECGKAFTIP